MEARVKALEARFTAMEGQVNRHYKELHGKLENMPDTMLEKMQEFFGQAGKGMPALPGGGPGSGSPPREAARGSWDYEAATTEF